jgi:hypothetical protein
MRRRVARAHHNRLRCRSIDAQLAHVNLVLGDHGVGTMLLTLGTPRLDECRRRTPVPQLFFNEAAKP